MRYSLLLLPVLLLPACGTIRGLRAKAQLKKEAEEAKKEKDKPAEETVQPARPVGKVKFVHQEMGFLLIEVLSGGVRPPAGTEVEVMGLSGVIAKLRISPEQKAGLITADILSGTPEIGQTVVTIAGKTAGPKPVSPLSPAGGTATQPSGPVEINTSAIPLDALPTTNLGAPGASPMSPAGLEPPPDIPIPPARPGPAVPGATDVEMPENPGQPRPADDLPAFREPAPGPAETVPTR